MQTCIAHISTSISISIYLSIYIYIYINYIYAYIHNKKHISCTPSCSHWLIENPTVSYPVGLLYLKQSAWLIVTTIATNDPHLKPWLFAAVLLQLHPWQGSSTGSAAAGAVLP